MRRANLLITFASLLALHGCGETIAGFTADASAEPTDIAADVSVRDAPTPPADVPSAPDVVDVAVVQPDVVTPRDAPPTLPDVPPVSGGVYDYVLNTLLIDPSASETVAHTGFNLDGRFSSAIATERMAPDCNHGDLISARDLDQNMGGCMLGASGCRGGVDNQLPALAETASLIFDLRAQLRSQINSGQLVFLVRVTNVDGELSPTLDDPEVVIRVYVGRSLLPASMCSGLFTPGARFAIDDSSLVAASDLNSARFAAVGSIRSGRLHLGAAMAGADLTLSLPLFTLGGSTAALNLRGVQLRMDMTADRAANGNLGGFVVAQEAIDAISDIPAAEMYRAIITSLVRGLVDIQVDGSCGLSGGVGMGLGFSAVRATIDPMSVSGPQPGRCGSF